MNRTERRAESALPLTAHPWEVGLVGAPAELGGARIEGLLAVVERGTGQVRTMGLVEHGEGLGRLLRDAFFAPARPQVPARPSRLLVADPALAARVSEALDGLGLRIERVDRVPGVEAAVAALVAHLPGPSEDLPLLVDADHAVTIAKMRDARTGDEHTGLVLKLRKADAVRVARRLESVDRLEVGPGTPPEVIAWTGDEPLGRLVELDLPSHAGALRSTDRVLLCVAAGGSRRSSMRPEDLLFVVEVAVGSSSTAASRHDAVFDGPRERWPKASETLLHFAEVVLGSNPAALPRAPLQKALEVAESVWNAVVLADFVGETSFLAELERTTRGDPLASAPIRALVARKRALFRGDPRVFRNTRLEPGRGAPRVYTESALPEGYTTASSGRTR